MTLNEAIFGVLCTQFKKDMDKEALKMIEDAGYEIHKGSGCYYIKNPVTKREIYVKYSYYGNYRINFNWYRQEARFEIGNGCPFDFVNCLNKPINTMWYNLGRVSEYRPTLDKYEKIKRARWDVNYHKREVENIVNEKLQKLYKQIEELTKDVQYHTERRVEAQEELDELKKSFGLK